MTDQTTEKPKRKWKTWHKVVAGVVVLVLIGAAMQEAEETAPGAGSASELGANGGNAPTADVALPEYNAHQLHVEFEANEIAASERLQNKYLIVSGIVDSVGKGPLGGLYVYLQAGDMFTLIHCSLRDSEKSEAARLQKGQAVRIKGRVGEFLFGSVTMDKCEIL